MIISYKYNDALNNRQISFLIRILDIIDFSILQSLGFLLREAAY